MKVVRFFPVVLMAFLFFGCAKVPDLKGTWKSPDVTLQITKLNDQYKVKADNPRGMVNGTFIGKYKDGAIYVNAFGKIVYDKENDQLIWVGNVFRRK